MFRHPDLFFILFFSTLITQIYTELRRFLIYFFICASASNSLNLEVHYRDVYSNIMLMRPFDKLRRNEQYLSFHLKLVNIRTCSHTLRARASSFCLERAASVGLILGIGWMDFYANHVIICYIFKINPTYKTVFLL